LKEDPRLDREPYLREVHANAPGRPAALKVQGGTDGQSLKSNERESETFIRCFELKGIGAAGASDIDKRAKAKVIGTRIAWHKLTAERNPRAAWFFIVLGKRGLSRCKEQDCGRTANKVEFHELLLCYFSVRRLPSCALFADLDKCGRE
jgi:hypothetical protein